MTGKRLILAVCIFCLVFMSACIKKEAPAGGAETAPVVEIELPKVKMFVTALDGLRVRNAPTDGDVIVTLAYLTEVTVLEEQENSVTISGATGKWTLIETANIRGWAFGGFLSEQIPNDSSYLIGTWHVEGPEGLVYIFRNDRSFLVGIYESGHAAGGTWNLTRDTLILTFYPDELGIGGGEQLYSVTVGNRNAITIRRHDGLHTANLRKR